eukprot:gb/GFBE01007037.1/.p1 GENE.gb/GFBE01007037.1/~~gb/GFBE01007037.1/.p1  ORF type:complete len:336 (+),score=84.25 gb/GFBE01007037.1/:1-1008(+)
MVLYLLNIMEAAAFGLLAYDACKGRTKHVSAQTCLALMISLMLSFGNLSKHWELKMQKLSIIISGSIAAGIATYKVAKGYDAEGEDDVPIPGLSSKLRKASVYIGTAVCGTLALLVAKKFSVLELLRFMARDRQAIVCTYQNFLHAFALLPQLTLCRKQGFVAPTAVRFLLILGVKHLYEFFSDSYVSYRHLLKGKLKLNELSFMSGDFIAALVLIDFLYLIAINKSKLLLCKGESELQLDDEEGISVSCLPTSSQESVMKVMAGKLTKMWNDETQRKQILALSGMFFLAVAGVAMEIVNIYAMFGAGAIFAGIRWTKVAQPCLPVHEKEDKCCV